MMKIQNIKIFSKYIWVFFCKRKRDETRWEESLLIFLSSKIFFPFILSFLSTHKKITFILFWRVCFEMKISELKNSKKYSSLRDPRREWLKMIFNFLFFFFVLNFLKGCLEMKICHLKNTKKYLNLRGVGFEKNHF